MTLEELKALRRGDVVAFFARGRNPSQDEYEAIGLVTYGGEIGVEILWEDKEKIGWYRTADDADKLTFVSTANNLLDVTMQRIKAARVKKEEAAAT